MEIVLMVLRLGVTLDAYISIAWVPSRIVITGRLLVALAVFAESVRMHSDLRSVVVEAIACNRRNGDSSNRDLPDHTQIREPVTT
jgi:hypothetical protein